MSSGIDILMFICPEAHHKMFNTIMTDDRIIIIVT